MAIKKKKALISIFLIIALASFMPAMASAQTDSTENGMLDKALPDDFFTKATLNVGLRSDGVYNFSTSKFKDNITLSVSNPTEKTMDVYLAVYRNAKWSVIGKLGTVNPGMSRTFEYPVTFTYNGITREVDNFGIIGKTNGNYLGGVFSIEENWESYEKGLLSTLSYFGIFSAVSLVSILLVIFAGVLVVATKTMHDEEAGPGEYTLKTLFAPINRARPMAEKIANIIISPFFWAVEFIFGAILIGLILLFALTGIRSDIGILVFLVGGIAALFMPMVFLVIGWLADYYEREPFRFIVAMFMWGVLATFISFFINTTLSLFLGAMLSAGAASVLTAVLVAPVVEETAKGLGLLIISGHHELDDAFDGILYGFAIGMGFAAVENWLYFASNASPVVVGGLMEWTYNILYRSFLCSLAHGCFTAATGGMIGYLKSKRKIKNFAVAGFMVGLPIAIIMHGLFNFTAIVDAIMQTAFGVPVPLFDPILTILATGFYIIIGYIMQKNIKNKKMANASIK
jgi:RsiW-degrading membrane proteinase PrsW (M82 family)